MHIWLTAQAEWGCATIRAAARGFEMGIGWYREQMTRWVNDMHFAMYWLEEMKTSESTPDSHQETWSKFQIIQTAITPQKSHVDFYRQVWRRSRSRSSWVSQDAPNMLVLQWFWGTGNKRHLLQWFTKTTCLTSLFCGIEKSMKQKSPQNEQISTWNFLIRLVRGGRPWTHGAPLATREIKKNRFEGYRPTKNVGDFEKTIRGN